MTDDCKALRELVRDVPGYLIDFARSLESAAPNVGKMTLIQSGVGGTSDELLWAANILREKAAAIVAALEQK